MALVKADEADYSIKPENITPTIDTSAWPLLLKNWDQRMCNKYRLFLLFQAWC